MTDSDGRRTIAERDREARIRGDLLRTHADIEASIRVRVPDDKWASVYPEGSGEYLIALSVNGVERILGRSSLAAHARALADALGLVLKCPVDTEAIDA